MKTMADLDWQHRLLALKSQETLAEIRGTAAPEGSARTY